MLPLEVGVYLPWPGYIHMLHVSLELLESAPWCSADHLPPAATNYLASE